MKCPFCAILDTKVIDSRLNQTGEITRRRRECLRCEGRFTTYERVEEIMPMIIKKDGRREPWLREKIIGGIKKACQKRNVPTNKIEDIVNEIEKQIQAFGLKEIPAKTVGHYVMLELHKLDKVAYVRFSSVYRAFKDVDDFVAELKVPLSGKEEDFNLPLFQTKLEEEKRS
ncbi:MAG: transcriptional repressor NrdR [Deltaproteobacteria bacterium]|nr:transcriptional repressor NrdR [Deltaproteobacteria bacterium]